MSEQLDAGLEAAGESAAIEAPDHTPEPEVDLDDAVEEAPSTEETTESVETEGTVEPEATVEEDFSDLTPNFIPPDEVIDKLRIPKEERAKLKEVTRIARESSQKLEEFGGEFAVNTFKPFAEIITKAQASEDELEKVFETLAEANSTVAGQVGFKFVRAALDDDRIASAALVSRFGENATIDNIKTLLALDKEGLIEKDTEYLGFEPTRVQELQTEIAQLKAQLENRTEPAEDKRGARAVEDFETDFHSEIPSKLKPVFEKAGWDADGALAKFVTETIQNRLKADARFTNAIDHLRQTGAYRNGEKVNPVAGTNLHLLKNSATALGIDLVRSIQADFRKISETRRNVAVKQKQEARQEVKEIKPQPLPSTGETFEQKQARLRAQFKAALG